MITKMRYASIFVTDLDQAMDFYVSKLGLSVLVEMPVPGDNRFVMLALPGGGTHLVFSLPFPGRPHTLSSAIAFETEDIQATYEELKAKGVEFGRPPAKTPWGGMEAQFTDPFGNSFLLQQGGL